MTSEAAMTGAVSPNAVRFDPRACVGVGHVESYFLKANDPKGERALWIKATIFCSSAEPKRAVAEGWAIAFDKRLGPGKSNHIAVKHVLPYSSASFSAKELDVGWAFTPPGSAEEERLSIRPGKTSGLITRRGASIGWSLSFEGDAIPFIPFPFASMYRGRFPKSKTLTPYPDLVMNGEVMVSGERWDISGWRGMQGHNWGIGHADRYAWCHVNTWEEDGADLIVEAMSGQVRVGPVMTPVITLVNARYRGVTYSWHNPIELLRTHGDIGMRHHTFSAEGKLARIEGSFEADTDDMVGLYYPNPDGPMTYCLNSKLSRADVRFEVMGRPPIVLKSHAAALEIGTRDAEHGVRMYV